MRRTDTIVIGGGQAGLAVSRCLYEAGRDHVVVERGRLGESWRSERWDSLRLLSPSWMNQLPGVDSDGHDPDGFLTAGALVDVFERYARSFDAPVEEQTTVESVTWNGRRYAVVTDQGIWSAAHVVVATGHAMHPRVPAFAAGLDPSVHQLTSPRYRRPTQLPDGGVLVVGGSATGTQIAEELARAGRDVVLAVGEHTRMPRTYRGLDIFWWLRAAGILESHIDDHPDPSGAQRSPSMQLVGSPERRDLDLTTCRAAGVEVVGRLQDLSGTQARFDGSLADAVQRSEARMHRTLDAVDRYIDAAHLTDEVDAPARPSAVRLSPVPEVLDLRARHISTVLWASGFVRRYPWLPAAALDERGEIRHHHGVGTLPGLYVVGLRFQRHRSSSFIGGVGRDAQFVVDHLVGRSAHEAVAA